MPKLVLSSLRQTAYQFIFIPALVVLLISGLTLLFAGKSAGFSIFLGGIVWVIPNGFVAHKLFSNVSARAAGRIVATFYFAETVKLLLTAALVVIIIKFLPLKLGYFLLSYGVAQIMFWLTAWVILKK